MALHAVGLLVAVGVLPSAGPTQHLRPPEDTRVPEAVVRVGPEPVDLSVVVAGPPEQPAEAPPVTPTVFPPEMPPPAAPPVVPAVAVLVPDTAAGVPRPPYLVRPRSGPPELEAVVRRSVGSGPVPPSSGGPLAPASSAAPLHGRLADGQTVVYVLDCSGSMGEYGKLVAARAALWATLRQQSEAVKVRVLAYNSTARPLGFAGPVPATAANVGLIGAELARLTPQGRSNHADGLRRAATPRPDVIVWLTDADDLSAAAVRPLVGGGSPVPVYLALVTPEGVRPPRELR